ncbi:MAG: alpha/beta hydrolase [Proteobacteria bacterium]|nr:alpha/beta hydrolase [Pseudomonadota bacterium]
MSITVDKDHRVGAHLMRPASACACYVLAHGAGAGMEHRSMNAIATGLSTLGVATLRFQFPYMQRGSRRPDPPALCHATVRAAVTEATRICPELTLFAGGRSFGGRMTSQAQALQPLPAVKGLVFLGFPLHPAGSPAEVRAQHLSDVLLPMLFVQGTADALAERALLEPVIARLGVRAELQWVVGADHSFHVPVRSGRNDAEVLGEVLRGVAHWIKAHT